MPKPRYQGRCNVHGSWNVVSSRVARTLVGPTPSRDWKTPSVRLAALLDQRLLGWDLVNSPPYCVAVGTQRRPWGMFIAAALVWGSLLAQLRVEWSINPQYSYGWGVPFLAIYLFWKRWLGRPDPRPSREGYLLLAAALPAAFLIFPLRLVQEANPDWRLISWGMATVTVALTSVGLWLAGGWPWLRHFFLPVAFILIAVPWPTQMEQGLIQSLMRNISATTAEVMNWMGLAARPRGNLIELANGVVGVNEACSGIRSFQATLMISVFAGELFRLSVARRVLLVLTGLLWSVLLNFVRTSVLTLICALRGPETQIRWHDPMGYLLLGLALGGVWWWASVMSSSRQENRAPPLSIDGRRPASWPLKLSYALAAWMLFAEVGTELWYRAHAQKVPSRLAWSIAWPEKKSGFQARPLPEQVQMILRCDESQSGLWKRADGTEWTLFFLKWLPGRMAAQLAKGHTPDVCLPASGFKMVADLGFTSIKIEGLEMPFNTYVFTGNGRPYYVFFCLLDDGGKFTTQEAARAARTYLDALEPERRLRAVWEGKRHSGQRVLEIAMTGYLNREQAQKALAVALPALVQTSRKAS